MSRASNLGEYSIALPLHDRLWAKIEVQGPDECWPWIAYRDKDGYGRLRVGSTNRVASALVCEEATGEPAGGRIAQHSCDHPWCCNPGHLSWGTHKSNQEDCKDKGRGRHGSRHGQAKLTEDQVLQIRSRYLPKDRVNGMGVLAQEFGVSFTLIDKVVRRQVWTHV